MSQIEHRKRLRERQEAAANRNLGAFAPATNVRRMPTTAATQAAPATQAEPVALDAVSADDAAVPQVVQPQPTVTQAIVPVDVQTRGMTPVELRAHAKTTAEMLASLPQAEYEATLKSIESNNPILYGIVVDELNNMAATQTEGEGDGYDLSGLAAGAAETPAPSPEVVGGTTDPNLPQDAQ